MMSITSVTVAGAMGAILILPMLQLQVTQAQPKHGGAGAFYVYLRRQR